MWPLRKRTERKRLTITKIELAKAGDAAVVTAGGLTFVGYAERGAGWFCREEARECSTHEEDQLFAAAWSERVLRRVRKEQEARDAE